MWPQTKAKLAKKSSKKKYQWEILAEMGVPEADIPLFANPYHWLKYFPPLAIADLDVFGLCTDWRRSFITTHVNPYYDAFIRWQFNTLKNKGKVEFGARSDAQPHSQRHRHTRRAMMSTTLDHRMMNSSNNGSY